MTDEQQPPANRLAELPEGLSDPRPVFARNDVANLRGRNSVFPRNDVSVAAILADFAHIVLGKFRVAVHSPGWVGAMRLFVGCVFKRRLPGKVHRRNTAVLTPPTRMRGLMPFGRRRSPSLFAYHSCDHLLTHHRVALPATSVKGPIETRIPVEGQDHFAVEAIKLIKRCLGGPSREGVAVADKAVIVRAAKFASVDFLVAPINSTYTKGSHREPPMLPWLEPARGAATPGGFAFCTTPDSTSQWVRP